MEDIWPTVWVEVVWGRVLLGIPQGVFEPVREGPKEMKPSDCHKLGYLFVSTDSVLNPIALC